MNATTTNLTGRDLFSIRACKNFDKGGCSGIHVRLMVAGYLTSVRHGDSGPFRSTAFWRPTPAGEQALIDGAEVLAAYDIERGTIS